MIEHFRRMVNEKKVKIDKTRKSVPLTLRIAHTGLWSCGSLSAVGGFPIGLS
jgi:hypothetical protein